MYPVGSLLRTFVAIVQIVALIVFSIPDPVHAYAGDRHDGHAHAAFAFDHDADPLRHGVTDEAADAPSKTVDLTAAPGTRDQAPGRTCLGCGVCQIFVQVPEAACMIRAPRTHAIPVVVVRALATISPEALPEPPRNLA